MASSQSVEKENEIEPFCGCLGDVQNKHWCRMDSPNFDHMNKQNHIFKKYFSLG